MKVVFFGTPEFAVPSLAALLDGGLEVPLVVTQPDRPVGRHAEVPGSPVAQLAALRGIRTVKPEKLRGNAAFLEELCAAQPDAAAVVAYGQILPREVLELPRLQCVNVHASLLPRYRGASPVQAALLAGDRVTGVVTMRIEEELDAGPIYLERRVAIEPGENAGELSERLAREGALLLVETLRRLNAGDLAPRPQAGEPSFCRTIRREDGRIDWTLRADEIERRLRAYTPWPGVFTFLGRERIKLLDAEPGPAQDGRPPGTLFQRAGVALAAAGEGTALRLTRLQRAGKRPVTGEEFLRGLPSIPARFE
ncbi:MAG: methionyl-tRNA formyltransferase [Thermoanaerobaculia bacterium]